MAMQAIKGGFDILPADQAAVNQQRALTKLINDRFIQVGACWLKPAAKNPLDEDWYKRLHRDVDLQEWIDAPELQPLNVGFNLQLGWLDIDIDSEDPEYVRCVQDALRFVGVDTRFAFGRRSIGVPSHFLVQLPEDESNNFEHLKRFEPKQIAVAGRRSHTQLRSYPTNVDAKNAPKSAKQTVVPGSLYSSKFDPTAEYDLSVWYGRKGIAANVREIADTTPRRSEFAAILRGIAYGTALYALRDFWVEGQRQAVAVKVTGWLARIVSDSAAIKEHEHMANEVFCPISDDSSAEGLIRFVCAEQGDDEASMRIRTYFDAREKLERNPDAKVPGWHSLTELLGAERVQALRTVILPGSDVSKLTQMAERYVYDETDNQYIDRSRHASYGRFVHDGSELERRHKGDTILVGGKPKEAFRLFEASNLRKRVGTRDMYPDYSPGGIYRIDAMGNVVPDEFDGASNIVFNTWKGWPIAPIEVVDPATMGKCVAYLDQLLCYLTRSDHRHVAWFKEWIAWTFQHPGQKQQVAPVIVGQQGVGKSFFGNVFMKAIMTERLWGSASPNVIDQKFNVGPFKDKMFVFIDEARFKTDTVTDEIKKLIRNVDVSGMEKFEEARDYRIFARICFASNHNNIHIGQRDTQDRALFYVRTYDEKVRNETEDEFKAWARSLKPWFEEYAQFLKDPDVLRHYMRFFLELPCDKYKIEDVSVSAGAEKEIVESNVSWHRRILRSVIESGWIASEDAEFETPYTKTQFMLRVQAEAKAQGMQPPHVPTLMTEFEHMGLADPYKEVIRGTTINMFRPRWRWAACASHFEKATSLTIHPYRSFEPEDHGDNESKANPPKERKGHRSVVKF